MLNPKKIWKKKKLNKNQLKQEDSLLQLSKNQKTFNKIKKEKNVLIHLVIAYN